MTSGLTATCVDYDPGSFRDASGRVFREDGEIYRALSPALQADWQRVRETEFLRRRMYAGSIVPTREVPQDHPVRATAVGWADLLWHETLPCISYPYEWTFGMLQAAALLQLNILQEALAEEITLKDATPYNIQFRGVQPVFIDLGSFTSYVPGQPWNGYRQFCMSFLYPLLIQAYRGLDFQCWLKGNLQGITPAECRRIFSGWTLLRRGVFTHVWLHALMDRHVRVENVQLSSHLRQHGFEKSLIVNNVRGLIRLIEGLRYQASDSRWAEYDSPDAPPSPAQQGKCAFVADVLSEQAWPVVWDLGCNSGRYSLMAAEHGSAVLALDADHATVERLYRTLVQRGESRVLPLRMNLADPSPGRGWRGRERAPLEQRSRPDLVLCLAVLHHLVLAENIPLPEVVNWLADLGGAVVIEFVDPTDPQARLLMSQRTDGGHEYTQAYFEQLLQSRFQIQRRQATLESQRTLYFATPVNGR